MHNSAALAVVSHLAEATFGVFTGTAAVQAGVARDQLTRMLVSGVIERLHPNVYRLTSVAASHEQSLRAALLWAGDEACADACSACAVYGLDGPAPRLAEIVAPDRRTLRSDLVVVRRVDKASALMAREVRGFRVVGPEAAMLSLARTTDTEALEIACEDARRRRLTSVPALRKYLQLHGSRRPGAAALRRLLDDVDPVHPSRSKLEVKTRRLLVAHGLTGFVREFPLTWNGRTYRYDFAFPASRTILETNGRRWHDDASDYEHDHEKWSVPARLGYRIVFATWAKIERDPHALLVDLAAALAA